MQTSGLSLRPLAVVLQGPSSLLPTLLPLIFKPLLFSHLLQYFLLFLLPLGQLGGLLLGLLPRHLSPLLDLLQAFEVALLFFVCVDGVDLLGLVVGRASVVIAVLSFLLFVFSFGACGVYLVIVGASFLGLDFLFDFYERKIRILSGYCCIFP